MQSDELGHRVRAWRDQLDPAAAGLAGGARRRAPGPRREERRHLYLVADLHAAATAYPDGERLAGPVTVDCDILKVQGAGLRLIVYSTAPDTPDAEALARLSEPVPGGVAG